MIDIKKGTAHYVDDIIIDLNVVSENDVVAHLKSFGLITKPHEDVDAQTNFRTSNE